MMRNGNKIKPLNVGIKARSAPPLIYVDKKDINAKKIKKLTN